MLYSSVVKDEQPLYSEFLETMDPGVRQALKPMHILHFWKRVGGLAANEPWMVVFAIDEVRTCNRPNWSVDMTLVVDAKLT